METHKHSLLGCCMWIHFTLPDMGLNLLVVLLLPFETLDVILFREQVMNWWSKISCVTGLKHNHSVKSSNGTTRWTVKVFFGWCLLCSTQLTFHIHRSSVPSKKIKLYPVRTTTVFSVGLEWCVSHVYTSICVECVNTSHCIHSFLIYCRSHSREC